MTGLSVSLGSPPYYLANSGFQPLSPSASASDSSDFDGGSLVVTLGAHSSAADELGIRPTSSGIFPAISLGTPVNGLTTINYQAAANGTPMAIGTTANDPVGGSNSPLTVSFAATSVDAGAVTALLDSISYENTASNAQANPVSISFAVADDPTSGMLDIEQTMVTIVGLPSIATIGTQHVAAGAVQHPVTLGVIPGANEAALALSATSRNQLLVPNSSISISTAGGVTTLSYTPVAGQTGTAIIDIVGSNHNLSFPSLASFTVQVDNPPSLSVAGTLTYKVQSGFVPLSSNASASDSNTFEGGNLTVAFGAGTAFDKLGIMPTAANSYPAISLGTPANGQTTVFYQASAASTPFAIGTTSNDPVNGSNPMLLVTFAAAPTSPIDANVVTALLDRLEYENSASTTQSGAVTVDYAVTDKNTLSALGSTSVTIVGPPAVGTISNQATLEGATNFPVAISGISLGQNEDQATFALKASSASSLLSGFSVSAVNFANGTATLTYSTSSTAYGVETVKLTATDKNNFSFDVGTFQVTVNDPPTLDPINSGNPVDVYNNAPQPLSVPLTGVAAGPNTVDSTQILAFSTSGFSSSIIDAAAVQYQAGDSTASLLITPHAGAHGQTTVTVTLSDNAGGLNSITRTVVVDVDQRPTAQSINPTTISEGSVNNLIRLAINPGIRGDGATDVVKSVQITGLTAPFSTTNAFPFLATYDPSDGTYDFSLSSAAGKVGTGTISALIQDSSGGVDSLSGPVTFSLTVGQVDQPPTIMFHSDPSFTASADGSGASTSPIDQGGTFTFAPPEIVVGDPDASPTDQEKLTLTVAQGTLSITGMAGVPANQIVLTDTLAKLTADLGNLVYTNNTGGQSDQLTVKIDDLGHNGTVVNGGADSLVTTKMVTIPVKSVAHVAFGTIGVAGDQAVNSMDYLARHPLTYTFPLTNPTGPSAATNLDFLTSFNLSNLQTGFSFSNVMVTDPATNPATALSFTLFVNPTRSVRGVLEPAGTIEVELPRLAVGQTANISFTVTTATGGMLGYVDSAQFDQDPSFATGNATISSATAIPVVDAGLVSIQTPSFDAKVEFPGRSDLLPPDIENSAYTDFPIRIIRTLAPDPVTNASGPATHDDIYVTLNPSGIAKFGPISDPNADYAIVVDNMVYSSVSPTMPIRVKIPAGMSSSVDASGIDRVYLRVVKKYQFPPLPDLSATLTLGPPVGDPLNGNELFSSSLPESTTVTLKHPTLIVNVNSPTDASLFDPASGPDGQYTLRGIIDALNSYATTLSTPFSTSAPIEIDFDLSSGSTIKLTKPLQIDVPVLLRGTTDANGNPNITIANMQPGLVGNGVVFATEATAGQPSRFDGSIFQSLNVSGFQDGILLQDGGITIQNSGLADNAVGVRVDSSRNFVGYNPSIPSSADRGNTFVGDQTAIQVGEVGSTIAGTTTPLVVANNLIAGNTIDGSTVAANLSPVYGVRIVDATDNSVGGTTMLFFNTISGNASAGIRIESTVGASGNLVEGNTIGLGSTTQTIGVDVFDVAGGTSILGNSIDQNGASGIRIEQSSGVTVGTTPSGAGNTISGNVGTGLLIVGPGSTGASVVGNLIGTDSTGSRSLGSQRIGIHLMRVSGGSIGGTAQGSGNVASGNSQYGVWLDGSSNVTVDSNLIGTNRAGTAALSNGAGLANMTGAGLFISGNGSGSNTIGGAAPGAGNTISGNVGAGVLIQGAGATGEMIQGNLVGIDGLGGQAIQGQAVGIRLEGVTQGATAISSNVVSGNSIYGVWVDGSSNTTISGNKIGTNAAATGSVANAQAGIYVNGAVSNVVIGGTAPGSGNVISGNGTGILVIGPGVTGASVQGNDIGTDSHGAQGLDGQSNGIDFKGVTGGTIGGSVPGALNLISGNSKYGIHLDGSSRVLVSGNDIGTNAATSASVANGVAGVYVDGTASGVGNAIANNVIAGNANYGVLIGFGAVDSLIQSNTIGILTASGGLGNVLDGINLSGVTGVAILDNAIGFNLRNGINATGVMNPTVLGNVIKFNQADGILISGYSIQSPSSPTTGVVGNDVANNGQNGVEVENQVDGLVLAANTIGGSTATSTGSANKLNGVLIIAQPTLGKSYSVALGGNTIDGNGQDGILLSNARGVQTDFVHGNAIEGNQNNGVQITMGSTGNVLAGGLVAFNQADGIAIDSGSSRNLVASVNVVLNQADGIHVDSGATNNTVTGGIARDNIGALDPGKVDGACWSLLGVL